MDSPRIQLANSSSFETLSQRLTKHFYEWELIGRGYHLWEYPVDVVPRFIPFSRSHFLNVAVPDDARVPSLFGGLFGKKARSKGFAGQLDSSRSQPFVAISPPPRLITSAEELCELSVSLPPKLKITQEASEQFILSLLDCTGPISFEVIGLSSEVSVQIVCVQSDRTQLEQQLGGYFPETVLCERAQFLAGHWRNSGIGESGILGYGLKYEFMRPLQLFTTFDPDPLTSAVGALSELKGRDIGILQILFRATHDPWTESILRAVTDSEGKPFFKDAPEILPLARQKIARPLFAAVIRVAARSSSKERCNRILRELGAALHQFSQPASNELTPLTNHSYSLHDHEQDLLERSTHRSGMLLNSFELTGLVHVPSASVRSERLLRDAKKTMPAPAVALGHQLLLGHNTHRGQTSEITLSPEQRMRHIMITGATGSGKTTLVKSMAAQNISNGEGCCVIDPHVDLINDLLAQVPEERYSDVIIFDPADDCPVPFNVLSAHSELEKTLLASDLVSIFRRQCSTWGDQLDAVLTNAILSFLESEQGGTLQAISDGSWSNPNTARISCERSRTMSFYITGPKSFRCFAVIHTHPY